MGNFIVTIIFNLTHLLHYIVCCSEHNSTIIYSGLGQALHRAVQENEMPMRMAYEQLDELAANADRVKFAIEKNRSLLTLQVLHSRRCKEKEAEKSEVTSNVDK
jgi:hypothetical protein